MRYIKQFLIILSVSFIGEILSYLIPFPIPGSIYGIVILFLGLITKIIPYDSVKDTGHFLIEIMPVMFIPTAVGLIEAWGIIKTSWFQYVVVMFVTTVFVMAVSGKVTQYVVKKGAKER